MAAYYNELNPYAAQHLRNLISAGHIADGDVDERDIRDVRPDDLRGYVQCHFFAGIGGWPLALRLAGWPDERPVWTGSAPCQPFSAAGAGLGFADERHLWPFWLWLIAQLRPSKIFGEQVASKDVEPWIDLVFTDLEATGYACGTNPFPSASVGAPHIRDRTYFVADADYARSQRRSRVRERATERAARSSGLASIVAHSDSRQRDGVAIIRRVESDGPHAGRPKGSSEPESRGSVRELADSDFSAGRQGCSIDGGRDSRSNAIARPGSGGDGMPDGFERIEAAGPTNGFWRDADWLLCRDEKWRPVEPGTFPLVDGLPAGMGKLSTWLRRLVEMAGLDAASLKRAKAYRVGTLRGYGNAINPHQAAEFIRAAREAIEQVSEK
ncbi:DNA cytosine methyltransferase [Paraburkholderia fungorum]